MKSRILILLLMLPFLAPAQKVAAIPDRTNILIGEQIRLQVFAEFNKGYSFSWFPIDTIAHFEVLDKSDIDTIESASTITLKQTLTLTSWDSGKWQIPALVFGRSATEPITVEVGHTPMDYSKPYHDIKDILAVKKPSEAKWYWYFILVIVVIALFMLFFPAGRKKEKPAFVTDAGAYRNAMNELDRLQKEAVDDKIFYTRLVQVFRDYLHRRKNIQSNSKTTDDLAIQMKEIDFGQEEFTDLVQTLRLSDLVKYAKFQASASDRADSISTIRKSITTIENQHAV